MNTTPTSASGRVDCLQDGPRHGAVAAGFVHQKGAQVVTLVHHVQAPFRHGGPGSSPTPEVTTRVGIPSV